MNILKELWYGNIYPNEQAIKQNSEYAQALHKMVEEKESLLDNPEIYRDLTSVEVDELPLIIGGDLPAWGAFFENPPLHFRFCRGSIFLSLFYQTAPYL